MEVLQAQHKQLDTAWNDLRPALATIEAGMKVELNENAVLQFVTGYQQHVDHENEVLTPAFRRSFSAAELEAIGCAMAARRGVDWEDLRTPK